ncbi:hypothetical protein Misp03_31710 [Microbispora sp. NBRC 16548]|nr:hypothetical protein Misp03_31710 [Microbispora sp. NBRC 16548]
MTRQSTTAAVRDLNRERVNAGITSPPSGVVGGRSSAGADAALEPTIDPEKVFGNVNFR